MAQFVVRDLRLDELVEVEADEMRVEGAFLIFRKSGDNALAPVRMIRESMVGEVWRKNPS